MKLALNLDTLAIKALGNDAVKEIALEVSKSLALHMWSETKELANDVKEEIFDEANKVVEAMVQRARERQEFNDGVADGIKVLSTEYAKLLADEINRELGSGIDKGRLYLKALYAAGKTSPPIAAYIEEKEAALKVHVDRAASRNGVDVNDESALREYHEGMRYDPDDETKQNPKRLFHVSDSLLNGAGGKPLAVLIMGNKQVLNQDTQVDKSSMKYIFEDLKDENDVVLIRVGRAWEEAKVIIGDASDTFGIPDFIAPDWLTKSDPSLYTSVVFEHTANVLEDIVKGRGLFANRTSPPSKVVFGGYSFGGDTVKKLVNEKWLSIAPNVPIAGTAFIDAVNLGLIQLGEGVDSRPLHTGKHLHIWQNNNIPINAITGGMPAHGRGLGNELIADSSGLYSSYTSSDGKLKEIKALNTNHTLIDDAGTEVNQIVKDYIRDLLK